MVKLNIAFAAVALAFTAIIIKLFYIQVLSPGTHQSQYLSTRSIRPERGRILDRNGEPLVVNQPAYLLYAEPKHIESRHTMIRDLDEILQMGPATLEGYLDDTKQWVAIKKNVDQDTKDKIESLQLAGLGFEEGRMRYYPEASLAAHIAGFVGRNAEDEEVGYFGIEGFYDKELSGLSGILRSETDLLGRPIFVGVQERVNPENGRDLYLTIDKSVQLIIKKRLIAAMERYEAAEGCVVVADPDSMQILGLTCLPDFDPTEYYNSSEDVFKNPAISNVYEPGSIFKPLIVAAGIEEKAIKPDERYDEDGPVQVGGYTIRTWNDEYGGRMSMSQILERSSNVGMVYIGSKLGDDAVYDYVTRLGFGQETGIDLQG
ncbi:MAG: penicillin-binding protein 2, partial [Leptospiraceae bacterium]|nr:penicillin-binding protein 2 [Leptospiraceae bacterium]